ncbi:hypothetical protein [Clostridium algidicarnis]|uniref:Uncharacterized protein n=2 Tax=Clostridium algidicarnis TaxID=37659 RepID=A0A2S6FUH2_9CLOT|nr:hypothetical protein [Clostridium algidicarnis]MBU3220937.1 hypothetical protein [Clostridium algidicarnis]PPK44146.1 hypothetical protein BD821_12413 [Clostridium algidicarnis DSM 15099]
MGITISSKRYSCDMGYGGFGRFRKVVAENINDEFYNHYSELSSQEAMFSFGIEREKYFEKYDAKTKEYIEKKILTVEVANFLYQSDSDGEVNRKQAKQIYELIKECDDNISFGYVGRTDCAKMADLKKIFSDKTKVEWR